MDSFEQTFSYRAVLKELCKARIKVAKKRNDQLFLHRISANSRISRVYGKELNDLFPPRRAWKRFRLRQRSGRSSFAISVATLVRAVLTLGRTDPNAAWLGKLNDKIEEIRSEALTNQAFEFSQPRIIPQKKSPQGHEYRPLAVFCLRDKIIDSLTAKYLRSIVEPILLPSSLAFRIPQAGAKSPTIADALDKIVRVNKRNRKSGLFVAECDIRGFFDCVSHEVARGTLDVLLEQASKRYKAEVSPRALFVFQKYLEAYEFQSLIEQNAMTELRKKDDLAQIKWPRKPLEELHSSKDLSRIGVPQGGALSCLIANAVLHQADVDQRKVVRRVGKAVTYLRYCDDMVVLSRDKDACISAFNTYLSSLQMLKLPAHEPKSIVKYSKEFWSGKSNSPYFWHRPTVVGAVPWIQFVGFQIRYDGVVRIRPKSLKKQRVRIVAATDGLLAALNPCRSSSREVTPFSQSIRKTKYQIQFRFQQQVLSVSVGRRKLGQAVHQLMPMCWSNGFRGLQGKRIVPGMLKALDRHRERQVKRIERRLSQMPKKTVAARASEVEVMEYYGYPFSYFGQFL